MKLHFNLATRVYLNRRLFNLVYCGVIGFLLLLLGLNGMESVRLYQHGQQVENFLKRLPEPAARTGETDLTRSSGAIGKRVGVANAILKRRRFHWSAFLDRMETTLPAGVKLRSLQPEFRTGSVRLEGVARGVPELRFFLEKLTADPLLSHYYLLEQAATRVEEEKGEPLEALRFSLQLTGVF